VIIRISDVLLPLLATFKAVLPCGGHSSFLQMFGSQKNATKDKPLEGESELTSIVTHLNHVIRLPVLGRFCLGCGELKPEKHLWQLVFLQ
jgi:hypothetical protein